MRVRRSVRQLKDGKILVKSASTKGARKLRCPKCKMLVAPNQQNIYKCNCGRSFRSISM